MATISTHNGSAVSRGHNLRKKNIVDKEEHIDPDGMHETWVDESPRRAYERLFGDSVRAYNDKQSRADRKIDDYYNQIRADQKKHNVYEMIIGVYPENGETIADEIGKEILKDFVNDWKRRNPNLEMVGAYYHADEQGKAPHVHIDYIPVAHGYKKGPETQTALVKALGEQGFTKDKKLTSQMQWEKSENKYLESLCNERGVSVEHPLKGQGVEHLHTNIFKAKKDLEDVECTIREKKQEAAKEVMAAQKTLKDTKVEIDRAESTLKALQGHILTAVETKAFIVKKSLFGANKAVIEGTPEELQGLVATAQKVESADTKLAEAQKLEKQARNILNQQNAIIQSATNEGKDIKAKAEAEAKEILSKATEDALEAANLAKADNTALNAENANLRQENANIRQTIADIKKNATEDAQREAEQIINQAYKDAGAESLNARLQQMIGLVPQIEVMNARDEMMETYRRYEKYLTPEEKEMFRGGNIREIWESMANRFGRTDTRVLEIRHRMEDYQKLRDSPHTVEDVMQMLDQKRSRGISRK